MLYIINSLNISFSVSGATWKQPSQFRLINLSINQQRISTNFNPLSQFCLVLEFVFFGRVMFVYV